MDHIPLSLVAPVRLTSQAPSGVFYPFKPEGVLMLATVWEDKPHVLYLNGEKPFATFPILAGYAARGSIVSSIEFRVDITSQYDSIQQQDPVGALIAENGRAYIMAFRPGGFEDPIQFPLWDQFDSLSAEEKVGFSRWSVLARDGDDRIELWTTDLG